jgi:hypothetical protein
MKIKLTASLLGIALAMSIANYANAYELLTEKQQIKKNFLIVEGAKKCGHLTKNQKALDRCVKKIYIKYGGY